MWEIPIPHTCTCVCIRMNLYFDVFIFSAFLLEKTMITKIITIYSNYPFFAGHSSPAGCVWEQDD